MRSRKTGCASNKKYCGVEENWTVAPKNMKNGLVVKKKGRGSKGKSFGGEKRAVGQKLLMVKKRAVGQKQRVGNRMLVDQKRSIVSQKRRVVGEK